MMTWLSSDPRGSRRAGAAVCLFGLAFLGAQTALGNFREFGFGNSQECYQHCMNATAVAPYNGAPTNEYQRPNDGFCRRHCEAPGGGEGGSGNQGDDSLQRGFDALGNALQEMRLQREREEAERAARFEQAGRDRDWCEGIDKSFEPAAGVVVRWKGYWNNENRLCFVYFTARNNTTVPADVAIWMTKAANTANYLTQGAVRVGPAGQEAKFGYVRNQVVPLQNFSFSVQARATAVQAPPPPPRHEELRRAEANRCPWNRGILRMHPDCAPPPPPRHEGIEAVAGSQGVSPGRNPAASAGGGPPPDSQRVGLDPNAIEVHKQTGNTCVLAVMSQLLASMGKTNPNTGRPWTEDELYAYAVEHRYFNAHRVPCTALVAGEPGYCTIGYQRALGKRGTYYAQHMDSQQPLSGGHLSQNDLANALRVYGGVGSDGEERMLRELSGMDFQHQVRINNFDDWRRWQEERHRHVTDEQARREFRKFYGDRVVARTQEARQDVLAALRQKRPVVIGVDAGLLHHSMEGRNQGHAILVTAASVGGSGEVHGYYINDTATGERGRYVPRQTLEQAWAAYSLQTLYAR